MNEEEKKALKVINARTRRLLDELEIEKEDMSDEPKIAYLMQEIRANKTLLNLIEKLQKENQELKNKIMEKELEIIGKEEYTKASMGEIIEQYYTANEECIPIQKVKDNIEKEIKYHEKNILDIENVNMLKSKTAKEEAEIEFNKYAIVVLKKMLQELIEERGEK